MNSKKIKLLIIGIFLSFAGYGFFISGGQTEAQTKEAIPKGTEILEKVADYKSWKKITKPNPVLNFGDAVQIIDSTAAG